MASDEDVVSQLDQLIRLFNERSMDLPDGLFSRQTQFLLNGTPFEEMLGRSQTDPLVLMLTRGAAGYRLSVKALQHAVPDAHIERGEIALDGNTDDARRVTGQCWLSGHLRGTREPLDVVVDVELQIRNGGIQRVDTRLDAAVVARVHEARLRT